MTSSSHDNIFTVAPRLQRKSYEASTKIPKGVMTTMHVVVEGVAAYSKKEKKGLEGSLFGTT